MQYLRGLRSQQRRVLGQMHFMEWDVQLLIDDLHH
jgi:hypothetical protein